MLRRILLLVPAMFYLASPATASVVEDTWATIFILDRSGTIAAEHCAHAHPHLDASLKSAVNEFHQGHRLSIELGKKFGMAVAAKLGKDIETVAREVAEALLAKEFGSNTRNTEQLCAGLARDFKERAKWRLEDFLREDFQRLVMAVGNKQGYPCSMIEISLEGLVRRYLDDDSQGRIGDIVVDSFRSAEAERLELAAFNCQAVQDRAAEYRTVMDGNFSAMREMAGTLKTAFAAFPIRDAKVRTDAHRVAREMARAYLSKPKPGLDN